MESIGTLRDVGDSVVPTIPLFIKNTEWEPKEKDDRLKNHDV
jgi:hypothetical protein